MSNLVRKTDNKKKEGYNMKHIKIEVKDLGEGWGKVLKIVEQTHRGHNFGISGNSYTYKNFTITSLSCISCRSSNYFYVRGSNKDKDNNFIRVPSEECLQDLRETVRAYNTEFTDKKDIKPIFIKDGTEIME